MRATLISANGPAPFCADRFLTGAALNPREHKSSCWTENPFPYSRVGNEKGFSFQRLKGFSFQRKGLFMAPTNQHKESTSMRAAFVSANGPAPF